MRIGILSDTHDQLDRTRTAVGLLREAKSEVLFHCGDLTGPEVVEACCAVGLPAYFVYGNNDSPYDLKPAMEKADAVCLSWGGEVVLAEKRIAVTHGHLHGDVRRLVAARPDYLFSGHTHRKGDWHDDETRRINPVVLYRAREYTVAILDLASGWLQFLMVD